MDSTAYYKATVISDDMLRERTREIENSYLAGQLTSREAADMRVSALQTHLAACREARHRYLEDRPA